MSTFNSQSLIAYRLFWVFCAGLALCISCTKLSNLKPIETATQNTDFSQLLAGKKPNIILILGDDVGYEIPTVNGGQSYSTPNLDKMAQTGMRFTQVHSSPLCSPSRVMLLTGKYNFRNYTIWGVLDTTNRTIANMLKSAGYKTSIVGKWQLDGGDTSLRSFGFDDYMIWSPFTPKNGESVRGKGSRYKDPVIYQNATFLPKSLTKGKYGDDIFNEHIKSFIDTNKSNPFFIYYPICLSHQPFEPAPNHPDYANWDPKSSIPDKKYFPSMINYMDTKVGEIMDKVIQAGIAGNTLIIFVGDNGTDALITSLFQGSYFKGGKSETTEAGTHVPMFMVWQGRIQPGSVNNSLIDFSDIMPTLADIARTSIPASYGTTDGISFSSTLNGSATSVRQWIYCYFDANQENGRPDEPPIGWVQDTAYKLYDSAGLFYHFSIDLNEEHPLVDAALTASEKARKKRMQSIIASMHK